MTGMSDNVVWGVYIVNFIFFMGLKLCRGACFRSPASVQDTMESPGDKAG
ncbi:MAG: hypothetical protein MZV63_53205 [Marinilabiliales bacterium]|nr:hypothetical protein [Marinilabiliales bacterium]